MATMQIGDKVTVSRPRTMQAGISTPAGDQGRRKYATAIYQRSRTNWHNVPEVMDMTIAFDIATGFEKGRRVTAMAPGCGLRSRRLPSSDGMPP